MNATCSNSLSFASPSAFRNSSTMMAVAMILAVGLIGRASGETPASVGPSLDQVHIQPSDRTVDGGEYIIGPDDVLNISMLDVPELSGEFRVSNTGKVTLPVLSHAVTAAGLTLSQFSTNLENEVKVAGLVSDPHVNTTVNHSRTHSIAITGAVKHPQVYPVFSKTTLHDVISQAEGLSEDASGVAIVERGDIGLQTLQSEQGQPVPDSQKTVTVDLTKLLETGDAKANIPVFPGDRVTVPHAGVVYVVGAVTKPGGFTMRPNGEGMTVLQALALAGDPTPTAIKDRTMILRKDPLAPDGHKQIPVDLKQVFGGKSSDPVLEADDILFVPDSTGKRAFRRGVEAALQVTTGIVIFRSH